MMNEFLFPHESEFLFLQVKASRVNGLIGLGNVQCRDSLSSEKGENIVFISKIIPKAGEKSSRNLDEESKTTESIQIKFAELDWPLHKNQNP